MPAVMWARNKTAERTTKPVADCMPGAAPKDPVVAVRVLPDGPTYDLDRFQADGAPQPMISVGAASYADIVIEHETVSRVHCHVLRSANGRVFISDARSKNRTLVNGSAVENGQVELVPGSMIEVGPDRRMLACSREMIQIPIRAANLYEFVSEAKVCYGSVNKAASALDIAESTLRRWLKTGRFRRKNQ